MNPNARPDPAVTAAREARLAGRASAALALLAQGIARHDPAALEEAALAADDLGRVEEAIRYLEAAVARSPDRAGAWVNLAALRAQRLDHRGAAQAAVEACRLAPHFLPAWINLGSARAHCLDYSGAIHAYSQALQLAPDDPHVRFDLASALFVSGEVGPTIQLLRPLLGPGMRGAGPLSLYLFALHYATNDPIGLAAEHRRFGQAALRVASAPRARRTPLRVGLVGGDFRRHSVWYFLQPLLANFRRHDVELTCFHTDRLEDEVTEVWQTQASGFHRVAGMECHDVAALIQRTGQDVLVSLAGHTTGGMPELFLRRCAPVQVSFLGYPGPLGSPNVDAWVADPVVAPEDDPANPHLEPVARLAGSYFCFVPPLEQPLPEMPRNGPVVFGSFNVLTKISHATVRLWSAVLRQFPSATLVVKTSGSQGPGADRLRKEFAACGVEASRIHWIEWCGGRSDHLARYGDIDIGLDTFPYNGATTTCEALCMGVPVVSLSGKTPASRMGKSILKAAGLGAWAAEDEATFLDTVAELVSRLESLRSSRAQLRDRVAASPLCDQETFTAGFFGLLAALSDRAADVS